MGCQAEEEGDVEVFTIIARNLGSQGLSNSL